MFKHSFRVQESFETCRGILPRISGHSSISVAVVSVVRLVFNFTEERIIFILIQLYMQNWKKKFYLRWNGICLLNMLQLFVRTYAF